MEKQAVKELAVKFGLISEAQDDRQSDAGFALADELLSRVHPTCNELTNPPPVHDPVNHPSHYTSHPSGVETIEITRHMGFNLGNAMKYLWRNGLKDGHPAVQDLEKAVWYIQDEIKRIKKSV